MKKMGNLAGAMIAYDSGDAKRINHFLKVWSYAKAIGEKESLNEEMLEILEAAAIVHDIGIKVSEEKYHSGAGRYQQIEGPPIAEEMLKKLGYNDSFISRVCFLVAHHHTYDCIDGSDYQILVEADFLVNIDEGKMSMETVKKIQKEIFRTETGKTFLKHLFL